MRLLITGSKGLIGSALKEALGALRIDVVGLDIRAEKDDPEYGSFLDREKVISLAEVVDGIVHLGAVSRVIDGERNRELCWLTNVEGTQQVIEAALLSGKKPWVLYASSREVYGHPKICPVSESSPLSPVNIYGQSKVAGEKIIEDASKRGLITAIVRFSNVFGSVHDHADRVIPAFCRASAQGTSIRVDGEDHVFDFTYIDDVVEGVLSLIRLLSQKCQSLPPIHLTSGHPKSLEEVAKFAQQSSEYPIVIVKGTPRSFDVSKFWGDTTRAQHILRWKACVTVEEGMSRLINQYRIFLGADQMLATR